MRIMFDAKKVKEDFPVFRNASKEKRLVYLDSAATSQKPQSVIDAVSSFYEECNANVHRGIYDLSEEATRRYEESRRKIAEFFHAQPSETVFTRNATESLNLVARTFGDANIESGDTILITHMEHHSNIVPWQLLAERKQAKLEAVEITKDGFLDLGDFDKKLEELQPKMVAVTLCSNVLGTINPVKELAKKAHEVGAKIVVDAAQAAPHMAVDVKSLDCDFLAVSGHKMLGPHGIGVLYGRQQLLEEMPPFLGGGDMIREVFIEKSTWNDLPYKFEAGTPSVADAVGMGAAVDYLNKLGIGNVREHEKQITKYVLEEMEGMGSLAIYGPKDAEKKSGVVAFNVEGVHPHDLASILNERGIAVRAGHHCAQPLLQRLGVSATARASFYVYTLKEDVDALVEGLKEARRMMA